MEIKQIQLHKYQDQAIFAPERFVALIAGVQSGKTIAGAIWSRKKFDEYPNDPGLIAAPTYKILMQSTLPKFFELNPDFKRYYKKGDSEIQIPGRAKIYIRSTENPNVLEGMTLRWAWLDEAGQMKLDAWINVQGRLSILQGECFITTTPYTLNWLYTDFYQNALKLVPEYKVVQFKSVDNPFFPKAEYERAKATLDPRVFRRRYEGLFEKMEGLVYQDFSTALHVIPQRSFDEYNFKEVIAGIDWGYNHPTAISYIGLDNLGTYIIFNEYYQSGKTTDEIIEHYKPRFSNYGIRNTYPDGAEPDRVEMLRRHGLNPRDVDKSKGSIVRGIDEVRALLRRGQLKITENCVHHIEEFNTYHYPEVDVATETTKEEPVKEWDDAMDAMRYALYTYRPVNNSMNTVKILNNRQRNKNIR